MKQKSDKQKQKDYTLSKIKKEKLEIANNRCVICGRYDLKLDLIHLLPRSLFPEYVTETWNLECACRTCHNSYDNSASSRRESGLYENIAIHDELAAKRYYQIN